MCLKKVACKGVNKYMLSEHKHCDIATTSANNKSARSRMEASSLGKRGYGGKGRLVKYWAHLGCCVSPCYGPFSLGAHFETYELLISLISNFFFQTAVNCGY
jgi:hypothetical protein